jgi:hypothetical protein
MADKIGNIDVPEILASGTFPIVPEYPYGRANHPDVAIHQFGSGIIGTPCVGKPLQRAERFWLAARDQGPVALAAGTLPGAGLARATPTSASARTP